MCQDQKQDLQIIQKVSADPVREAPVYFSKPRIIFWLSIKKLQELSPSLDPKKDVINTGVKTGSNQGTGLSL